MKQELEKRFTEGQFKFMDEDFEGCIAVFTEILEVDPHCAKAYQARAIACLRLNDDKAALKDIEAAIKCEPKNSRLYYHKGAILLKRGNLNEALEYLNNAIDLSPAYAPAYVLRSKVYERLGDQDAADMDMNHALVLKKETTQYIDF
jgi:Flp pilus assembly protein TadD